MQRHNTTSVRTKTFKFQIKTRQFLSHTKLIHHSPLHLISFVLSYPRLIVPSSCFPIVHSCCRPVVPSRSRILVVSYPRPHHPLLSIPAHINKHCPNMPAFVNHCITHILIKVAMPLRERQPHFSFGRFSLGITQFCNKSCGVDAFLPRLGNIRTHRPGRPSYLIGKRIFFFFRKSFAYIENLQSQSESYLVNIQFPEMPNLLPQSTPSCMSYPLPVFLSYPRLTSPT